VHTQKKPAKSNQEYPWRCTVLHAREHGGLLHTACPISNEKHDNSFDSTATTHNMCTMWIAWVNGRHVGQHAEELIKALAGLLLLLLLLLLTAA
jgi:hypothetical protein